MADLSSTVDRRDPPPYLEVQYIECDGVRLHGRRLTATCLAGDVKEIRNGRTGCMRDTAVGAWIKGWWHWGGPTETDPLCHYQDT